MEKAAAALAQAEAALAAAELLKMLDIAETGTFARSTLQRDPWHHDRDRIAS